MIHNNRIHKSQLEFLQKNLNRLRVNALDETVDEFADAIGVCKAQVYNLEAGRRKLSAITYMAIKAHIYDLQWRCTFSPIQERIIKSCFGVT